EDLDLVAVDEEDAAVAAALAPALDDRRRRELQMKLEVAELVLRADVADPRLGLLLALLLTLRLGFALLAGGDLGVTVLHHPGLAALPFREVLAVEEDDRVRRHAARRAGIDDLRL